MAKQKTVTVTVRLIPHPNPQQAIDLFARLGLSLYEKEIARESLQLSDQK